MTTLFTPIDYYTVVAEPPMVGFDWNVKGLSEFLDSKYQATSAPDQYGFSFDSVGSRNNYQNPWVWDEPIWTNLRDSLKASVPNLIARLIDLDQQQTQSPKRWSVQSINNLIKNSVVDIYPAVDENFDMNWHLDARNFFASGILNITENVPQTDFSRIKDGEIYHTMNHRAGKGSVWLNTESNWHRLRKCPWPRKIVQFNISVVPFS